MTAPESPSSSEGFRLPPAIILLFGLLCLVAIVSSFAPAGAYLRDEGGNVIPGTFSYDASPTRPHGWGLLMAVFTAPVRGLVATAEIIGFVLVIGGVFRLVEDSGALTGGIHWMVDRLRGRENLFIPVSMLLFAAGGAVFGMSEEVIPFVLLFVPLVRALGYPPVVAVAIPVVGSGLGFAGAMINPFTIGVALGLAGLPPMSGWPFRTGMWVLFCIVGIVFVVRRSNAVRVVTPPGEADTTLVDRPRMPPRQVLVLAVFGAAIASIAWGSIQFGWYVTEVSAVFLMAGVVTALAAGFDAHRAARSFTEGAVSLLSAALVIALARSIVVIASDMRTLDPLLYGVSNAMGGLPEFFSLSGMFTFQLLLNILIPSGSGQAALTIPIMAPLSDLIGLNRQLAVVAFQMGDGITNLITPTSAVLMGSLHAAGIDYERWFKFAGLLQVWLYFTAITILAVALAIGFGY